LQLKRREILQIAAGAQIAASQVIPAVADDNSPSFTAYQVKADASAALDPQLSPIMVRRSRNSANSKLKLSFRPMLFCTN